MCGLVRISSDLTQLNIRFAIPPDRPLPNFAPTWSGAPTDNLPVVRLDRDGRRSLDLFRWGLVPYWAKDIKIGFSTINAMAETVDTKPYFVRRSNVAAASFLSRRF